MSDLKAYRQLIAKKAIAFEPQGLKKIPALNSAMFPYQEACTEFALRTGCAGLFLSTGLGKSLCSLDWGRVLVEKTNKPVLMLAPLAVSKQHEREAEKFGIDAKAIREPEEINGKRIYVTNYERLAKFQDVEFGAVVLDESSILKGFNGRTSRALIETFAGMPFRLSATATPAPNDHMELGQQSEFLGCMRSMEMLSRWFINDTSTASQVWRLKGHAVESFWNWVASWARCATRPSDLGFDDASHILPDLIEIPHTVDADLSANAGQDATGQHLMFRAIETSATSIHNEKRLTSRARANKVAEIVGAEPDQPWIVWVDTDYDADAVMPLLPDAVEVRGNMKPEAKEEALIGFSNGDIRVLVTKPSVAGFGLNWQHCRRMAFTGLSFSFESYHQAVRRCWRFGQTQPVHVHTVMASSEKSILDVINRKKDGFEEMGDAMRAAMLRACNKQVARVPYEPKSRVKIPAFMGVSA
jgi:hypothetical protein